MVNCPFKCLNTGAPQGSVLSPIPYTMYLCVEYLSPLKPFLSTQMTALVGFLKLENSSLGGFEEVENLI